MSPAGGVVEVTRRHSGRDHPPRIINDSFARNAIEKGAAGHRLRPAPAGLPAAIALPLFRIRDWFDGPAPFGRSPPPRIPPRSWRGSRLYLLPLPRHPGQCDLPTIRASSRPGLHIVYRACLPACTQLSQASIVGPPRSANLPKATSARWISAPALLQPRLSDIGLVPSIVEIDAVLPAGAMCSADHRICEARRLRPQIPSIPRSGSPGGNRIRHTQSVFLLSAE